MPLSRARNRQRMRLERKVAKMAHWGLSQKREEANDRLEKAISPPQESKAVQPKSLFHRDAIGIVETPYSRLSLVKPDIDADGNMIPDYE